MRPWYVLWGLVRSPPPRADAAVRRRLAAACAVARARRPAERLRRGRRAGGARGLRGVLAVVVLVAGRTAPPGRRSGTHGMSERPREADLPRTPRRLPLVLGLAVAVGRLPAHRARAARLVRPRRLPRRGRHWVLDGGDLYDFLVPGTHVRLHLSAVRRRRHAADGAARRCAPRSRPGCVVNLAAVGAAAALAGRADPAPARLARPSARPAVRSRCSNRPGTRSASARSTCCCWCWCCADALAAAPAGAAGRASGIGLAAAIKLTPAIFIGLPAAGPAVAGGGLATAVAAAATAAGRLDRARPPRASTGPRRCGTPAGSAASTTSPTSRCAASWPGSRRPRTGRAVWAACVLAVLRVWAWWVRTGGAPGRLDGAFALTGLVAA